MLGAWERTCYSHCYVLYKALHRLDASTFTLFVRDRGFFDLMSRRGGDGRRGGRGDYPREQHPSVAPAYPTGGGGRGGRGGTGGNGRGRGAGRSGGSGGAPSAPPAMMSQRAPPPITSYYSPPVDVPSSSAAAAAGSSPTSLSQELEQRLTIRDPEPAAAEPEAALTQSTPASSKALRPPARPGFGKAGVTCIVRANHFLVEVADKSICHYDVRSLGSCSCLFLLRLLQTVMAFRTCSLCSPPEKSHLSLVCDPVLSY